MLISVQAVEPIKIPVPNNAFEIEIHTLLDNVLAGYKKSKQEIDLKVYELSGLTQEEIEFIE